MTSLTRGGEHEPAGTASSTSRDHQVHQSEPSSAKDSSRNAEGQGQGQGRLQLLGAVQGARSMITKKPLAGTTGLPPRGGEEAECGAKKSSAGTAGRDGLPPHGGEAAECGAKKPSVGTTGLPPRGGEEAECARRSRSRDRRMSMSILDTVFRRRRRRRPSLTASTEESSDSEASSANLPADHVNSTTGHSSIRTYEIS